MLDRSPVMWTRDLTKEAHPAFCSAGTADPVNISSNHTAGRQRSEKERDAWRSSFSAVMTGKTYLLRLLTSCLVLV